MTTIEGLVQRRDIVAAAQQTRNLTMMNSLLGSASLILLGMTANVLLTYPKVPAQVVHPESWDLHPGAVSAKLYLLILVFAVASFTDFLDGYVARTRNQVTGLGTVLDPLADKALVITAVVLLSLDHGGAFGRLPVWLAAVVIARDAVLVVGTPVVRWAGGHIVVQPSTLGKATTVCLMLTILWSLCRFTMPSVGLMALAAGALTVGSGVQYVVQGCRGLRAEPPGEQP